MAIDVEGTGDAEAQNATALTGGASIYDDYYYLRKRVADTRCGLIAADGRARVDVDDDDYVDKHKYHTRLVAELSAST